MQLAKVAPVFGVARHAGGRLPPPTKLNDSGVDAINHGQRGTTVSQLVGNPPPSEPRSRRGPGKADLELAGFQWKQT